MSVVNFLMRFKRWPIFNIDLMRTELSVSSFFQVFLPPLLAYYIHAVLACLPGTNSVRTALLPLVLSLAYRSATTVDLSFSNERLVHLNQGLVVIDLSHPVVQFHISQLVAGNDRPGLENYTVESVHTAI
jgi:hypothetical protein